MHTTNNWILFFVIVSVITIHNAESQEPATQKNYFKLMQKGVGFHLGVRFHQPDQIARFITDIYDAYLIEYYSESAEKKHLGPGVFLTLKGNLEINPIFSATPFAQYMWAGKQLYFSSGPAGSINVNSHTVMGGLNLWVRVLNQEFINFRIGMGFYGAYTFVTTGGDIPHRRIRGSGIGGRALMGSEYRLNEKTTLTLDCCLPFGKSKLYHFNQLKVSGIPVTYPTGFNHFGFELCPGVMFYF